MKRFSILLLCFFSIQSIFGQLLYEIKAKSGGPSSYLFGTIHMMPKEEFILQATLLDAFNKSKTLAMEVDLNMDLSMKLKLATQTILPDGKDLKDFMKIEDYQKVQNYCIDSLHISQKKFEKYSRLKPIFLSTVLLESELENIESYEMKFNEMASKSKKKTMGLESIETQFQTLNTVSIDDQIIMLMEGLGQTLLYDDMLKTYKAEDLDLLYNMIVKESEGFPNFIENFLNKRNRNWIPVLENQIENEPTFVAVGAGHLPGETGILSLLRAKGYVITAIPLN